MTFPLPGGNWTYTHTLRLVATTGLNGFALQNATPTILSWTPPNDGNMHRFLILPYYAVTVATTGGKITVTWTGPDNISRTNTLYNGTYGTTGAQPTVNSWIQETVGYPGTAVTIAQNTALTVGAAVLWAEIWAL